MALDRDVLMQRIDRIPFLGIVFFYALYLGWDYYQFTTDQVSSPLFAAQQQQLAVQTETETIRKKLQTGKEFFETLEKKKEKIRVLSSELGRMKAGLSEEIDTPGLVKMVVTEAKRIGLQVLSIKPTDEKKEEFYTEKTFEMGFRGVYAQLVVFIQRLSRSQRILRMDEFEIAPSGPPGARFVELSGKLKIKAYRYSGTKADDIAEKSKQVAAQAPSASPNQSQGSPKPGATPGGTGGKP